ncbi:trypsin-like serine peptidase [Methylocystis parvus]|uniref:Trypsin-like peptidase domain-containing protein n=1 Tax=Methylocystis parvus TaxID=134 RepID=A0A6B8M5X5_9HYPH|nr:serine protease [Methylocystis parvus]QGM96733.1 trypsin-like peptidase domain-containing protein [Methylocystis parvus]WBJ99399.1 serine protease [Methylocystis parvus OBBP]
MTDPMVRRLIGASLLWLLIASFENLNAQIVDIALYPQDGRRLMNEADAARFAGAGVLMCYSDYGTLERGAAAWLIGSHDLVVLNAHNFVDRNLIPTHAVGDCFFRIAGGDYYFDADSLRIGASVESKGLHITDDWALLRLIQPTPEGVKPQPLPDASDIATGSGMTVTMVSPAGHSNTRLPATVEACAIHRIDEPTESHVRRARHDCNDGYGGSGSGLFSEDGRLIALHSASLDMNRMRPFDIEAHYGSAILFEGDLAKAIWEAVEKPR